jgi:hypothetical protein
MAVELVLLVGSQVEGVEGVVDTGGVERIGFCLERCERRVDTLGLLLGFGCFALWLRGQRCLLFGEEGGLLSLLALGFGGLCGGSFATSKSVLYTVHVCRMYARL